MRSRIREVGELPAFAALRLSTDRAAPFYERLGFTRVREPKTTHRLGL